MAKTEIPTFNKKQKKDFSLLTEKLAEFGLSVRREPLSRGHAFRVKSGHCVFQGSKLVFLDKRLPPERQIGILSELVKDL